MSVSYDRIFSNHVSQIKDSIIEQMFTYKKQDPAQRAAIAQAGILFMSMWRNGSSTRRTYRNVDLTEAI